MTRLGLVRPAVKSRLDHQGARPGRREAESGQVDVLCTGKGQRRSRGAAQNEGVDSLRVVAGIRDKGNGLVLGADRPDGHRGVPSLVPCHVHGVPGRRRVRSRLDLTEGHRLSAGSGVTAADGIVVDVQGRTGVGVGDGSIESACQCGEDGDGYREQSPAAHVRVPPGPQGAGRRRARPLRSSHLFSATGSPSEYDSLAVLERAETYFGQWKSGALETVDPSITLRTRSPDVPSGCLSSSGAHPVSVYELIGELVVRCWSAADGQQPDGPQDELTDGREGGPNSPAAPARHAVCADPAGPPARLHRSPSGAATPPCPCAACGIPDA